MQSLVLKSLRELTWKLRIQIDKYFINNFNLDNNTRRCLNKENII